ncbi:MAG TPA: protein kinase [Gemmataceae bacterium]|nr:protein kinase [Gemmataceae bacterium]
MNPERDESLDERWLELAAQCDEALAAGQLPPDLEFGAAATELQRRLDCMRLLRGVWPSGHAGPADSPPPTITPANATPPTGYPSHVGRFEIRRELGRGGFGVVFLVFDPDLGREVALKLPRPNVLLEPTLKARFQKEARAAAGLDHPHIVTVYEAGEADGICYIASAYCPGISLAEWLRDHREPLAPQVAANLVAVLAEAVQHAHERGVLHRDLKPANILLSRIEDRGSRIEDRPHQVNPRSSILDPRSVVPRITDFGLAKLLGEQKGVLTRTGDVLGTPNYMAPEQADPTRGASGPATDVWGLGALLYELLTGRPPFLGDTPMDTLLQVRDLEPVPPVRLRPGLSRDLDTICLKCLEKEPARRYSSAAALAADLHAFLAGKPIAARPTPAWEKVHKWARRKPGLAAALAALVLVTVAALSLITWKWLDAEAARAGEQAQRELAERRAEGERRALEQAQEREGKIRAALYLNQLALVERAWLANDPETARKTLAECPVALRAWEWHYLRRLCEGGLVTLGPAAGPLHTVAFHPNGRHLAVGGEADIAIWDTLEGKKVRTLDGSGGHAHLAYSRDGKLLAATAPNSTVRLWDATTGELLRTFTGHTEAVARVAFAPDGKRLATASHDGTARLWDVATGEPLLTFRRHTSAVVCIAWSPDGKQLASASFDGTARLWDPEGHETHVFRGHTGSVSLVAFTPDGRRVASGASTVDPATGTENGEIKIWDTDKGEVRLALLGFPGGISGLDFSPDGKRLAVAASGVGVLPMSRRPELKIWDAMTGRELLALRGHTQHIGGAVFSPDGRRLASVSFDRSLTIWDTSLGLGGLTWPVAETPLTALAFSRDGKRLACGGRQLQFWTLSDWKVGAPEPPARVLPALPGIVRALAFQGSGESLAVCRALPRPQGSVVDVTHLETGNNERFSVPPRASIGVSRFSPDGLRLTLGKSDVGAELWAPTGKLPTVALAGSKQPLFTCAAWSEDGSKVVTASQEGNLVQVWDTATGALLRTCRGHAVFVQCVASNADGSLVASASVDGVVKIWDMASERALHSLPHPRGMVGRPIPPDWQKNPTDPDLKIPYVPGGLVPALAFTPDGRRLATAAADATITLWDIATGQEALILRLPARSARVLAFSPDGHLLACICDKEGAVRVFNATPLP